jgi:Pentapeptide repeats (8 copies)
MAECTGTEKTLMANPEHLEILRQGVDHWNAWTAKERFSVLPDLDDANLSGADLSGANFSGADLNRAHLDYANLNHADLSGAYLSGADLSGANLGRADLSWADLRGADLSRAFLEGVDLSEADLSGGNLAEANLSGANLSAANLSAADLSGANLSRAILVETTLVHAILTDCSIYGISAWGVKLSEGTKQQGLIITPEDEPAVTVDDLEVAQFVYLLLHNEKIRNVIDTITSKVVLILGRFSIPERKAILDALRDELRKSERGYVPVVFDFEKPNSRTTDETITLLARMARFVIADVSDAKSVLQELRGIVPDNPTLPVQPIIVAGQEEPGMFDFFKRYPWFLEVHRYDKPAQLLAHLNDRVIGPAEAHAVKLRG